MNWPEETKINLLLYLKKCIFFEHLNHDSLLKLIAKVRRRAVDEGEVVLQEGESGEILYIVEEGRFKCEKKGSS
jgi:CRP-like cAMP-binding protein